MRSLEFIDRFGKLFVFVWSLRSFGLQALSLSLRIQILFALNCHLLDILLCIL